MSKRFYYDEFLEEIYDEQIDDYPSNQSICGILNQQDQRIAELEKAIVPKFKIGQIVYFNDDYGQILSGSIIAFDYYTSSYIIIDIFGNEVWRRTGDVLKTKEEAEQKLAEIKGERDD